MALVSRKAEEYLRLSRVKCAGLSARTTETGRAAVCLDLAAACARCPLDRVSGPGGLSDQTSVSGWTRPRPGSGGSGVSWLLRYYSR